MKLRNKKTGEVVNLKTLKLCCENSDGSSSEWSMSGNPATLAKFNEEWEDYEGPKEYWYITDIGCVGRETDGKQIETRKACGNYFETREGAEEVVEKLKAWKRLRDKGFEFAGWDADCGEKICWFIIDKNPYDSAVEPDLDLLSGGEG